MTLLDNVTEQHVEAYHIRLVGDPASTAATMNRMVPPDSRLAFLRDLNITRSWEDYYIWRDGNLPIRRVSSMEVIVDRIPYVLSTESIYYDFGKPLQFPADLPK